LGAAPIAAIIGTTVSPAVPIGASLKITVAIATAGTAMGSDIEVCLTAKTTAHSVNGPQTDTGSAWVYVARGPVIAGIAPANSAKPTPKSTTLPVADLVNGEPSAQAQPQTSVTLQTPFTNIGEAPAFGVVVIDQVPPQLDAVPGSLVLQSTDHGTGKNVPAPVGVALTLSGRTVTATIPQLAVGIDVTVAFQATVNPGAGLGTTIDNPATIAAQSITTVAARPAVVFVGAMNTVYDALGGSALPVANAIVALANPATGLAAKLPQSGTALNPRNANPFTTPQTGAFSFFLDPAASQETAYNLGVRATGYLNREIKVAVVAGPDGLPRTTISALDGLPLATTGGFGLTPGPISVVGISGFFGNVPLFPPQLLALSMTVDRSVASAGDRLGYALTFGPGSKPVPFAGDLSVELPPGVAYAHGTTRIDGQNASPAAVEPVAVGRTLTWPIASLAVRRTLTFDAVVLPNVTEGATISTRGHLVARILGGSLGSDASASVAVVGGPLSARTILTGRVFTDRVGDGHFALGDAGLAAVRIFLEDGESVLTDADGRYSFPAARPGMHVLHLDPFTLPPGTRPYHGFAVNDPRSVLRLVHGIFDSGLMEDVNFAVRASAAR
jgi:uncharacterized repeat protein (TIGR01451 family)